MKKIDSYDLFVFRVNEKLHINEEVDKLSQFIFDNYSDKKVGKYIINIDPTINIIKIILNIIPNTEYSGKLEVNKCFKNKGGNWIMYIDIEEKFKLGDISHEISHAFELTRMGKTKLLNKLDFIKKTMKINYDQIDIYFHYMYIFSDEEISSVINESYSYLKQYVNNGKIKSNLFNHLVMETKGFRRLKETENISIRGIFSGKKDYQINNFLYVYEKNIVHEKTTRINSFLQNIKYLWNRGSIVYTINNIFDSTNKYKPKRNLNYYDDFFKKQSEKLKKRLYGLYDHFSI